ncbi:MAG: hypothetical protein H0W93_04715, partial [Gammaproteobacteria bacterium]|nr:hypothetical protein [Gammaproteobacteria bacterium]
LQRMDAEDLIAVVFPDQLACAENLTGKREVPDHPLVEQTLIDCLHDAMDVEGLEAVLTRLENGEIKVLTRDLAGPSPLAQEILSARPYAFLDDAPAEERRTQMVQARGFTNPEDAARLGELDADAIAQVRAQAWPEVTSADELHDALTLLGFISSDEADPGWHRWLDELTAERRATVLNAGHATLWVCGERLALLREVYPEAVLTPPIEAVSATDTIAANDRETALTELIRGRLQGLGRYAQMGSRIRWVCRSARSTPRSPRLKPKASPCAATSIRARPALSGASGAYSRASIATHSSVCVRR